MAVPKRRVSSTRRDTRRKANSKLDKPTFSKCDSCGELKLRHRICKNCGTYRGRQVIEIKD